MTDEYRYHDPDSIYTDPATGVLRNKLGITDQATLSSIEALETAARIAELDRHPIRVSASSTLLDIHGFIFANLYHWAGKVRRVEISKQGKQFLVTAAFPAGFAYIDTLIAEYRQADDAAPAIARCLAEILDSVNYLHPFREGNGRAQREFIRALALERGYRLNLNPATERTVYERYTRGTVEGDVAALAALITSIIERP
ncbi:MAG: Fic family protein [Bifidobacteriaceae bacterium]|nr:Fic family protein [Bifidobacteriaceae bacterium]